MSIVTPRCNGEEISNFSIKIHRVVKIHRGSSEEGTHHVETSLIFKNRESTAIKRVPISKLSKMDWIEEDDRVSFTPPISPKKAAQYIAHDIQSVLSECPVVNVYQFDHPGLYKVNGKPLFCTGGEVIGPPADAVQASESEVECAQMPQWLDIDPMYPEEKAAAEVLNLIALFPDPGRVILLQTLVALMRQAYEDAGNRPSFCVFLHGRTGTQKTTIASFLTQIYNRSDRIAEPTRLNISRASAVEMLLGVTDQVVVFDDLFPSASNQVRKKQEETLSEIIRYIGDGTVPTKMKGSKVREGRPKCGVLFTREYLIGSGSDAARLFPVEMTKPDTAALRYYQERPLIVSTFYRNFIAWFTENYDEIVEYLREWLALYRKTDLGIHDRLRETHFFLNTTYALLLNYCGEKKVLTEDELGRFHGNFLKLLTRLSKNQNERVAPGTAAPHEIGNALEKISEWYQNGQFSIAQDKSQFDDQHDDGIIHTGNLCLRPRVLSHVFPGYNAKDVAQELAAQGAIKKNKSGLTRQISGTNGKRFYFIPLQLLQGSVN